MSRFTGSCDMALSGRYIAKAFVNHCQGRGWDLRLECAGRVVGVDHNAGQRRARLFLDLPAVKPKGGGMFIITAQGDLGLACNVKCRDLSNGRGASRHSQNIRLCRHPPKSPCGRSKRRICAPIRQRRPIIRPQIEAGYRVAFGIDSGG